MSTATVIIGLFSDRQCRPFLKLKAECYHFARRCSGSPRFSAEPLRGKPPNGQYRNSVLRKFLGLSTRTPLWIRHVYLGRRFLVYTMTCVYLSKDYWTNFSPFRYFPNCTKLSSYVRCHIFVWQMSLQPNTWQVWTWFKGSNLNFGKITGWSPSQRASNTENVSMQGHM